MPSEPSPIFLVSRPITAAYYEGTDNPRSGERIAARIEEVVARIAVRPGSGRLVAREQRLRVVPLLRYPYLVFYEIGPSRTIRVLHIRHTSRRPWSGR